MKYLKFTDKVVTNIDNFINERYEKDNINKETLESKIDSKLYKLSEVVKGKSDKVNHAKVEIEQMVSDITHQVKTPISNIRMYSDTIINNDLSKEQEKEFFFQIEASTHHFTLSIPAFSALTPVVVPSNPLSKKGVC